MIGGILRGGLSPQLRQHSQKMTSILSKRRLDFGCGAYCTSAGDLVPRSSGITSKSFPSISGSLGSQCFPNWFGASQVPPIKNAISASQTSKPALFPSMSEKLRGDELVEVFSVFVYSHDHDVSAVCGRIRMYSGGFRDTFERDLSNPEVLSEDKSILSLECHTHIYNHSLKLDLYLIDPVHDLELCWGGFYWSDRHLTPPYNNNYTYLDERLSTLLRGKHGYAVVHYSIFSHAYSALVEVTFLSNEAAIDVYGTVYARYSEHDYATDYQKKCFRSRLFNRPCRNPVQVTAQSSLPLMKSVLAVPGYSSLIIDVDLCIRGITSLRSEVFLCSKEFEVDHESPRVYMEIPGTNYRVGLSVLFYSGIENLFV